MLTIIAPSLDDKRIYPINRLTAGEVHRTRVVLRHPSGKGANAARAASRLGGEALLCAMAGRELSDLLHEEFLHSGIRIALIETVQPTRTCITVLEDDGRASELVQEALPVEPAEAEAFLKKAVEASRNASVVLLTGSLPPGCPEDFYLQCTRAVHRAGGTVVIDAQGVALRRALEDRPAIVKCNRSELAATLEREVTPDQIMEAAESLQQRGARTVIVTDGGADAVLCAEASLRETCTPPTVSVLNPIGSGDAMSGALSLALHRSLPITEAFYLAVAAGSANAASLLPGDIELELVEELYVALRRK